MQEFRNDEAGYTAWLDHHSHGFVLNLETLGSKHWMIHKAECTHLYETDPTRNRTANYGKVCAASTAELYQWAATHGYQITACS